MNQQNHEQNSEARSDGSHGSSPRSPEQQYQRPDRIDEVSEWIQSHIALPQISREFTIKKKIYTFQGPDHQYVQDLLQILDDKQKHKSKYHFIDQIETCIDSTEQIFDNRCILRGRKITLQFTILVVMFVVIYVVYVFQAISIQNSSVVQAKEWKNLIAKYLPYEGLYFTLFTIIYMHVNNWLVTLVLFAGTILIPLYLIIWVFYPITTDNLTIFAILVTLIVSQLHGHLMNYLYAFVRTIMSEITAAFSMGLWCLIFPYLIGFTILGYLLTESQIETTATLQFIISQLYVPLLVTLIFSWLIIKARLIDLTAGVVMNALQQIKLQLQQQFITQGFIVKYAKLVAGVSLSIAYIALEIYLFVKLANELTKSSITLSNVILFAFLLLGIPIFLILGIFIATSARSMQITFLLPPLFCGAVPIFWISSLSFYLSGVSDYDASSTAINIAPLLTIIFWLTLALFGVSRRNLQLYLLTYLCYFVGLPVVFLTLANIEMKTIYSYISYALILLGLAGITGFFMYQVHKTIKTVIRVREISNSQFPDFGEFRYYYLTEIAFWINSIFFLCSYYWISQFFWDMQQGELTNADDSEKGVMYSLLILHPVIFILINVALASPSEEDNYLREPQSSLLALNTANSGRIQSYQNLALYIGVIVPFVFGVIFAFIYSQDEVRYNFYMALAIGIPVEFIFFKILLIIKTESGIYQNFFQPFVASLTWCCIIFPFGVIVPALSVIFNNKSDNYQTFAQLAVAGGLLICILGVTCTSLFFQILLNREEFERKKRIVLQKVIDALAELAVICDLTNGSQFYLRFLALKRQFYYSQQDMKRVDLNQKLRESLLKGLYKKQPIYHIPYTGPILAYDQQIIGYKMYLKYKNNLKQLKRQQIPKQRGYCAQLILDCLFCRCGLEELENLEKEKENEIITLLELLALDESDPEIEIENYLPHYDDLYKISEQNFNMVELATLDPEVILMKQKQPYKNIELISTTKTQSLQNLTLRAQNPKDSIKLKQTEFYQSLISNDRYVTLFLHEVFMEFANNDGALQSNISYLDLQQLCRLTDINITLQEYQRFSTQIWFNQNKTLSEQDFANLLKFKCQDNESEIFQNLRNLVLETLYPKLIVAIKPLLANLKEQNRKMMQNQLALDTSPFQRALMNKPLRVNNNFNVHSNRQDVDENQNLITEQNNDNMNHTTGTVPSKKMMRQQKQFENQLKIQSIEEKYQNKITGCKKLCYNCAQCLRTYCCDRPRAFLKSIVGSSEIKPKQRLQIFSERQHMPNWKIVAETAVKVMIEASDEYDDQIQKEQLNYKLRLNISNILALINRTVDIYSFMAFSYNDQVDWFGLSSESISDSTDGSAFYDSYKFYFFLCCGISLMYGLLARLARTGVQNNTFGQDEEGNIASFPHPQFLLSKLIAILSGQFILVMKTFIGMFVCNYDDYPYVLVRDSSMVCMSNTHFAYIAIALIGAGIYYPLSTFLQPTFQYQDHSLDIKYKSSYLVIYIQCKLLILGLSVIFQQFPAAFMYQILFSTAVLGFLITLHVRMNPCSIKWFNQIEQLALMMVLGIYIGAFLIMSTNNNVIGLVFAGSCIAILIIIAIYNVVYLFRGNAKVEPVDIDDNYIHEYKPKQQKNAVDYQQENNPDIMKNKIDNEKQSRKEFNLIEPTLLPFQDLIIEDIPFDKVNGQQINLEPTPSIIPLYQKQTHQQK